MKEERLFLVDSFERRKVGDIPTKWVCLAVETRACAIGEVWLLAYTGLNWALQNNMYVNIRIVLHRDLLRPIHHYILWRSKSCNSFDELACPPYEFGHIRVTIDVGKVVVQASLQQVDHSHIHQVTVYVCRTVRILSQYKKRTKLRRSSSAGFAPNLQAATRVT